MHSRPAPGAGMTQKGIFAVYTPLHLSMGNNNDKIDSYCNVAVRWPKVKYLSHSLSMCSLGSLSLLLEGFAHQHNSHLGNDNLCTQWHINYLLALHNMHCDKLGADIPSQTGQSHGLVTGWGQRAAEHGFFTHLTYPACKGISMRCDLKRLTGSRMCVCIYVTWQVQSEQGFPGSGMDCPLVRTTPL